MSSVSRNPESFHDSGLLSKPESSFDLLPNVWKVRHFNCSHMHTNAITTATISLLLLPGSRGSSSNLIKVKYL